MSIETRVLAFPVPPGCGFDEGMTLRDYFAAKAMQGMCSGDVWPTPSTDSLEIARRAYAFANAMLKARET